MNNLIIDVLPKALPAASGAAPAAGKPDAPDLDLFRMALGARLGAARPAAKPAPAAAPQRDVQTVDAIQKKIAKLLAAGTSQAEAVATLAADLAAAVAQSAGVTGPDARSHLQSVFATALAPPGTPDEAGGSIADRAKSLAQRYIKVAAAAKAAAEQSNGQQKRIAGDLLDAQRAKDIPAPTTTGTGTAALPNPGTGGMLSAALTAEAGLPDAGGSTPRLGGGTPASGGSAPDLDAQPMLPLPAAPPAALRPETTGAGDGKRVNLGSAAPVANGGDTVLGRILTRAALAVNAGGDTPQPVAAAPAARSDTALSAFVKSFEAALHAADTKTPDASSTLAASVAAAPAADAAAIVPAVAPFAIDRAPAVSPPPAAPPAAAPVDHSAIADQVLRGALLRNIGESSEMRLTLVPETLGDVSVKLIVNAGTVTAHVVAQTPEVRDALVAAQPQLTKSLADAGLKLSSFNVDLAGGFAGFAQQHDGQPRDRRSASGSNGGHASDDADADLGLEAIPSFAPSAAGSAGAGDYNYLA